MPYSYFFISQCLHLSAPAVSPIFSPTAASADSTPAALIVHSLTVPPTASVALPVDHPSVPTQSQDEDEIQTPVATLEGITSSFKFPF